MSLGRVEVRQRGRARLLDRHAGEVDDRRHVAHGQVARLRLDHGPRRETGPRGDAAQRVVAVPAGDLLERDARPVGEGREERLDRDLVRPHRRLQGADVEVVGGDGPASVRSDHVDAAAEEGEHHRHLRGGVRVHERPDGGAPVADGRVRDVAEGERDQRLHPSYVGVGEHVGVPGQRPDPDPALVTADEGEVRARR